MDDIVASSIADDDQSFIETARHKILVKTNTKPQKILTMLLKFQTFQQILSYIIIGDYKIYDSVLTKFKEDHFITNC